MIREHFLGDQQIVDRLDAAFTKLKPMREHVLAPGLREPERRGG